MLFLNQIIRCCNWCSNFLSLFKLQVKFDDDELSKVWIQCNSFNKYVICHISGIKQGSFKNKMILPVFIKAVVFHHVGISWMIATKEKTILLWIIIMDNSVQEGHGLMRPFVRIFVALYLSCSLSHHIKIYMTLCVYYVLMKTFKTKPLVQQIFMVFSLQQKIQI